jgi:hypothetical protein
MNDCSPNKTRIKNAKYNYFHPNTAQHMAPLEMQNYFTKSLFSLIFTIILIVLLQIILKKYGKSFKLNGLAAFSPSLNDKNDGDRNNNLHKRSKNLNKINKSWINSIKNYIKTVFTKNNSHLRADIIFQQQLSSKLQLIHLKIPKLTHKNENDSAANSEAINENFAVQSAANCYIILINGDNTIVIDKIELQNDDANHNSKKSI